MIHIHKLLRDRLIARAGLSDVPRVSAKDRFAELQKSEWSPEFEQLMRNRLIMGGIRYGFLGTKGKPQYDRIASIKKRLNQYRETGNLELLVDAANLCVCEFVEGDHPNRHFHAHDDGEHTKVRT